MKRTIYSFLLILVTAIGSSAQVPQKFSYQAAVRNSSGQIIANQSIALKASLLVGGVEGEVAYSEIHLVETSPLGLVNLTIGNGGSQVGDFALIPWSETIFIKVEIDPTGGNSFVEMGTSQILSVPYALQAGGLSKGAIEVKPTPGHDPEAPIFFVRNSNNEIVFAVYESGVRVYIDDTGKSKSTRGGFAIGGLADQTKGAKETNYLTIQPDSVRFNIQQTAKGKSTRGGFAIGGLADQTKEVSMDYLSIRPDSIRFALDESLLSKSNRGGFAIGGLADQTKTFSNYFLVNRDCTFISNTLSAEGNVVVTGDILTGGNVGTLPTPSVFDADGNKYSTKRIGNQTWMAENLRTTKYADGTSIPELGAINGALPYMVPVDSFFSPISDPRWGLLYALQLVEFEHICPTGWRLPTFSDWTILIQNSGGPEVAGAALKDENYWYFPINYPTNGYNARPVGMSYYFDNEGNWDPSYNGYGMGTAFWTNPIDEGTGIFSSNVFNIGTSDYLSEAFYYIQFNPTPSAYELYSIRCIKE
jgi:uncharacterized protein (TIGR02145 family)